MSVYKCNNQETKFPSLISSNNYVVQLLNNLKKMHRRKLEAGKREKLKRAVPRAPVSCSRIFLSLVFTNRIISVFRDQLLDRLQQGWFMLIFKLNRSRHPPLFTCGFFFHQWWGRLWKIIIIIINIKVWCWACCIIQTSLIRLHLGFHSPN